MEKVLVIDPEICTGCRICEQVCSVVNENVVNPYRARIKVMRWDLEGVVVPMVCQQCDTPMCMEVCPVNALEKNPDTGVVTVNYDRCIGCRMCVAACPFGLMMYDFADKKVIKCEQCQGDPQCVRFCDAGALRFENKQKTGSAARKKQGEKLKAALSGRDQP